MCLHWPKNVEVSQFVLKKNIACAFIESHHSSKLHDLDSVNIVLSLHS